MSNPYYKLGPIKEEIVHYSPNIWMYHDVASPLETKGIIETAGPFVSKSVNKSGLKLRTIFFKVLRFWFFMQIHGSVVKHFYLVEIIDFFL